VTIVETAALWRAMEHLAIALSVLLGSIGLILFWLYNRKNKNNKKDLILILGEIFFIS
jgi:signal recognition particle receptor subunit beta